MQGYGLIKVDDQFEGIPTKGAYSIGIQTMHLHLFLNMYKKEE
jgi:hypothetical protein